MSNSLKIKLSIAGRLYPLTINPTQEEGLRKASKKINEMIKKFEQSYAVRDKQDVLAMCALQVATQVEQQTIDKNDNQEQAVERLKSLDQLLHDSLA